MGDELSRHPLLLRAKFVGDFLSIHTHSRYTCHTLQWRHNQRNGVINHRHHGCLIDRLFRHRSKKTLKHRVTGLCNSPVTGVFPMQMVSNAGKCFHLITSSWLWSRNHVSVTPIRENLISIFSRYFSKE